ncbi:MAG: metallopeptidase family protein [Planctomycetota bacterium]
MLSTRLRQLFDRLLEDELAALPPQYLELMDEIPLIVEDEPSGLLLDEMGMGPDDDLAGLHWGTPLTERSVEAAPDAPDRMMLFRGPIVRMAGFSLRDRGPEALEELRRQVHITLLHELGHHVGLDEDDLDALGYG